MEFIVIRENKNQGAKSMKKKRIVIISLGALFLVAAGVFLFCISHKEKAQVSKEPVERQLPEGMITASGLTSVGMNTEILKLDFLSTELYVEESYLSVGDEVEAGTKVFKISEETLKEAKKELSDKVTETELAYRQGVIDYEADLLEADSTYQKASISAAYAQTNYEKQEAEEKQKVKDLQEQVEQARELLEEYRKSEEEDYYRTYYQIDELYEEYYEHFQLLMSFYEKWDVEELSGEEQTGNGGAQMTAMGNQAGSGDTEKLSVYQKLDELVTQEGEEYQTALENYEKAKATAKAGLKKAESDLTDLEAQLTQAQAEYEQNLIEYKAEYDTALAENEDAELIYSTTKQSLEETLEDLKDEMEEAKENQDSFLTALSDGCFYTEKAGTIVVNAVTDDTYLSGNTLVIAYSNPETVSITAQVDQDDIAQISIGEQAYVMISEYGNYEGTVTTINPVTQAESRTSVTYEVTVTLTGDVQGLTSNLTAYVYFGDEIPAEENFTPPEGDGNGDFTPPRGDGNGDFTPPEGDGNGDFTPPEGDMNGDFTPSENEMGGDFAPPGTRQGMETEKGAGNDTENQE